MQTKIRSAYKNLFIGINECKSEPMLHHYDVLRGLFIDTYQPQITAEDAEEFTDYRMALKSAIINKRTALAFEFEDYIETTTIVEAIDEGMIAHQFNEK